MTVSFNSTSNVITIDGSSGAGSQVTGTGTITSSGETVTGTGTAFSTQAAAGYYIITTNLSKNLFAKIASVASATTLIIETIGVTKGFFDGTSYSDLPAGTSFIVVNPAKLSDLLGAVNDSSKMAVSSYGKSYTLINGSITQSNNGWIEIQDNETLNKQGSQNWIRTSGGIIMNPLASVQITGSGAGSDNSNNSFRAGFYFLAKYDPLKRLRPVWHSSCTSRDDGFTEYYGDESTGLVKFLIQGLYLTNVGSSLSSYKFYSTSDSFLNNIYFLTTNSSEYQVSTRNGVVSINNLVLSGATISTSPQSSSSNAINLYNPTFLYPSSSPLYFGNINGGSGLGINIYNPVFPLGAWNGQTKTTSNNCNVKIYYTEQLTYLSGISPTKNVKVYFSSSDTTNAPAVSALSSSSTGAVPSVNLLSYYNANVGSSLASMTGVSWSAYARKPNQNISPYKIFSAKQFSAADTATYQTSANAQCTLTDAQMSSSTQPYSYITLDSSGNITVTASTTPQEIYNATQWWLYQDAQMGVSDFSTFDGTKYTTTKSLTGASFVNGLYTSSNGSNIALTLAVNKSGARIRLADNSGTEKNNAVLAGTSTTLYFPPGSTGSWTGAVELYGYGRQTFSVNVTGGGAFSTSVVMLADSTVSDTLTNVSAYTALDTSQKIRDWIAYYNQTATGIATPLTASLTASSLSIGATTLAKGGTLGYASGVLTTGGTTLSGVNISTTGTQTASKLPTLTYPQQFTDATGTTNWLKVTLDSGQVAQDSYSNAFKTASYTTFLPASYTGTTTLALTARGYKKQVLTIPYSTSLLAAQSVTLIPDASVSDTATDFLTTATALTTEQQMYDAYSQWQATSTGILDTYFPTKSPGALDFGSVAATFDPSAAETVARGSGTITFKTGAVASGTYYSTGAITVSGATLGDSVKIRGANLNSEIVLDSIDSLRVYPTSSDRDSNTNLSFTVSTPVYRFKYGATVSGATMSGTLYTRPSSNGEQSLKDFTLASGNSVFSLSQLGLIQATLAKVNSLPTRDNNQADLAATEKRIVASM